MGLPGTANAPIHLSGGMRIENLDATSLVVVAFVFALVSFVIAVAAIVVAITAIVRLSDNRVENAARTEPQPQNSSSNGKKSN